MNILFSYAFVSRNMLRFIEGAGGDAATIIFDSGAFSVARAGAHIMIGEYMHVCRQISPHLLGYIMLDVAGDKEGTKRNLDVFLEKGLEPMPVWTFDANLDDLAFLKDRMPSKQICVAGGADSERIWMAARYKVARDNLGDDVFIHGLGFTAKDTAATAVDSVDSSTHQEGQRRGILAFHDPDSGQLRRVKSEVFRAKAFKDLPSWVQDVVVRGELQETLAVSRQSGDFSWVHSLSTLSWVDFALHLKQHGIRLFFACTDIRQLVPLALVCMHRKGRMEMDWDGYHRDKNEVLYLSKKDMSGFISYFKEASCKVGLQF